MIFELNDDMEVSRVVKVIGPCERVGLTSGCFDLLHPLHLVYLQKCRRLCDFLIVGVDADDLIQDFKAKRPVIPEHQRALMVDALRCVDATFIMVREATFALAVNRLHPHRIFKHKLDFNGQPVLGAGQGIYAAEVILVRDVEPAESTSGIVAKILRGAQPQPSVTSPPA